MRPTQVTRFRRQLPVLLLAAVVTPAVALNLMLLIAFAVGAIPTGTAVPISQLAIMLTLAVLAGLLTGGLVLHRTARRVSALRNAAERLARGDFKTPINIAGHDEFAEIGHALAQVSRQLEYNLSRADGEMAVIQAERNKLRGVLDSMTDGVFALDHDGRIILFNKAASELTGRSIADVAGQLAEKVMPFRSHGELVMTRWLATHQGNGHKVGEWTGLELYRSGGESLFVNVRAVVLPRDPNGISALVTFHDLTADHRLEEMKVDFVALAAHELRTPLTEIKGYLDIMEHEAKLRAPDRLLLEQSISSARELSGLINNLLNVARIEHGELGYYPEVIDYHGFLTALAAQYEPLLKRHRLRLILELPDTLPPVFADTLSLREVLNNLLANAINHTEPGEGVLRLKAKVVRREVETTLSDYGCGITKNALSRLFTKFYRVDEFKATTRGTGLGLYISKSIIEASGGHIWVESTEGEGSTFGFVLPQPPVASRKAGRNNTNTISRGPHGWIKKHTVH